MKRSPLKRKTPLKCSTRLNPVSAKRAKQNAEYWPVRARFLIEHTTCERCNQAPSCDVHHKAGRVGAMLCKVEYFAALCRPCHDAIHHDMKTAEKEGWVIRLK